MKKYLIPIFLFFSTISVSQETFSIRLESSENEFLSAQKEIAAGEYWIGYYKAGYDNKIEDFKGYLLKIKGTDTVSYLLNQGDTIRVLKEFIKTSFNHYLLVCAQWFPPDFKLQLYLTSIDSVLNHYWQRDITLPDSTRYLMHVDALKSSSGNCYIIGSLYKQFNSSVNFCCKLNENGNIDFINYRNNPSPIGTSNTCFSADSNYFLTFGNDYGIKCCVKTDTNYIVKKITSLPGNELGGMQIPIMGKLFHNDSVLLIGTYLRSYTNPQNNDIGVSKVDTMSMENTEILYSGSVDTIDYPAECRGLDYLSDNNIFYAGTKNIDPFYYTNGVSWIIIGQYDNLMNKMFEYFYGGDAYYVTQYLTATSDGGCLISATKYYPTFLQSDLWILKLNNSGLFTGILESSKENNNVNIYYNPIGNKICFNNQNLNYKNFTLFDLKGSLVLTKNINQVIDEISTNNLKMGLYIYTLETENKQYISSGKILIK